MTDLRIYNLLHKKVSGQLTDAESAELLSLESNPGFRELRQDVENIWIASKDYYPNKSFNVAAAKAKFKQNIAADLTPADKNPSHTSPISQVSNSSSHINWIVGIAVVGIIALMAYMLWPKQASAYQEVQTETLENNFEYAMLDDHTEVWLEPGSILKVSEFDEDGKRNISLRGEAFFDVEHDPAKPFVVEMGNDNYVEVLGTSFNIITDTGDESAKIDVKQGSVRVYNLTNPALSTIVTAGETALINDNTETIETKHNSVIYSLLGTSLSFRNNDLYTVFDELENVYQVEIDYNDAECLNKQFTSPLMDNFSLEDVMKIIVSNYSGLNYSASGASISIEGSACD